MAKKELEMFIDGEISVKTVKPRFSDEEDK